MLEFLVDGYADVIRIEDDEEIPLDFLKYLLRNDEALKYKMDDMSHELGKL